MRQALRAGSNGCESRPPSSCLSCQQAAPSSPHNPTAAVPGRGAAPSRRATVCSAVGRRGAARRSPQRAGAVCPHQDGCGRTRYSRDERRPVACCHYSEGGARPPPGDLRYSPQRRVLAWLLLSCLLRALLPASPLAGRSGHHASGQAPPRRSHAGLRAASFTHSSLSSGSHFSGPQAGARAQQPSRGAPPGAWRWRDSWAAAWRGRGARGPVQSSLGESGAHRRQQKPRHRQARTQAVDIQHGSGVRAPRRASFAYYRMSDDFSGSAERSALQAGRAARGAGLALLRAWRPRGQISRRVAQWPQHTAWRAAEQLARHGPCVRGLPGHRARVSPPSGVRCLLQGGAFTNEKSGGVAMRAAAATLLLAAGLVLVVAHAA